jgi:alpha,alpha-trehalase
LITAEALRRYGFNEPADRISREWVSTVLENFKRDGTIREKYNVVTRTSEANVAAGYKQNVVGFGWTNGVTLQLLYDMNKPHQ